MSDYPLAIPAHSSLYNYCLWPYSPSKPLTPASLPSLQLLYDSFDRYNLLASGTSLISNLLLYLGPSKTVFGVKSSSSGISWEFYFYDYSCLLRQHPFHSIYRCFGKPVPLLSFDIDSLPYLMFSVEITPSTLEALSPPVISFYFGNPGGSLYGGKSYLLSSAQPAQLSLANTYHFYDFMSHRDDFFMQADLSPFLRLACFDLEHYLATNAYLSCDTICLANKRLSDSIYFSGVPFATSLNFMKSFRFSPSLLALLQPYQQTMDYLSLDVGIDFDSSSGSLTPSRVSFYSVF